MSTISYLEDPARGLVAETRPLQVQLAKYIDTGLSKDAPDALLIEAGTGIGKSYAYLVNAITQVAVMTPETDEHAPRKQRIVVSTAMKSLQQQLYQKDLPRLAEVLGKGYKFKFARQVGKANHACKRRVFLNVYDRGEQAVYTRFFDETPHWIWDEAPKHISLPLYHRSHSVGYCSKSACEYHEECSKRGYLAARMAAQEADILIVNHALVGADIRVQNQHQVALLGNMDILIVDEAHKFPEEMRKALAADMPRKFFDRSKKQLENLVHVAETCILSVSDLQSLRGMPKEIPGLNALEGAYADMCTEVAQDGACSVRAARFAQLCRQSTYGLERTLGFGTPRLKAFFSGAQRNDLRGDLPFDFGIRENDAAMQVLHFLNDTGDKLLQYANAIDMTIRDRLRYVVSCDNDGREPRISVTPIQIQDALKAHYETRQAKVVYLSATLALNGNFEHFASEVGANPQSSFLAGTPFNYAKQAYGYFPHNLPDPTKCDRVEWRDLIADECDALLRANEGHAFILFTANEDMNAVAQGLQIRGYPYPLLVQSDAMKPRARETFLNTPNATLLGTRSFWEGIDIPGLHLSLVIIPKLPFPNPKDPLIRAKSELAGDQWFSQVSLPAMLTDLKQMSGRLIRSVSDLGVIAVLDSRLHTKPYGQLVRNAIGLPKHGTTRASALKALGQIKAVRDKQTAEPGATT